MDLLKNKGRVRFTFAQLDKIMQNVDHQQFTFDSFKSAYDEDPRIQDIVKNFDRETIELKTSSADDINPKEPKSKNKISQMAKRAVDL